MQVVARGLWSLVWLLVHLHCQSCATGATAAAVAAPATVPWHHGQWSMRLNCEVKHEDLRGWIFKERVSPSLILRFFKFELKLPKQSYTETWRQFFWMIYLWSHFLDFHFDPPERIETQATNCLGPLRYRSGKFGPRKSNTAAARWGVRWFRWCLDGMYLSCISVKDLCIYTYIYIEYLYIGIELVLEVVFVGVACKCSGVGTKFKASPEETGSSNICCYT